MINMRHRLVEETTHRESEAWVSGGSYFVAPPVTENDIPV